MIKIMESASFANFRLLRMRTRSFMERVGMECLNMLGNGLMATLDPNPLPFYLLLLNHWNELVKYVIINGHLHLDLPSQWPLNDPTV